MIAIVDYGIGNLGSIQNMFKKIGIESQIVNQLEKVQKAQKIVLPGVGAFDAAVKKLNASGLRAILEEKALKEKVPFLGICLGMQLLGRGSEEGK
ncbi:MAG: gamma-glutamyl-gamma-aminobutyrate hydrolase family protein, partial [Flavisolibacter sp.]|nr:gamma-glutamyl-gamma-aminobutyrate hydrolase family protein [Flavisolibacter sp.]